MLGAGLAAAVATALMRLSSVPCVQILDWDYYIERLGSAIQKIITIPAALQQVRASRGGSRVAVPTGRRVMVSPPCR